jgi:hypothetical protein
MSGAPAIRVLTGTPRDTAPSVLRIEKRRFVTRYHPSGLTLNEKLLDSSDRRAGSVHRTPRAWQVDSRPPAPPLLCPKACATMAFSPLAGGARSR